MEKGKWMAPAFLWKRTGLVLISLLFTAGCEKGVNPDNRPVSGKYKTDFDYISEFGKSRRLDRYYFEGRNFVRYSIDANNFYRTIDADTSLDVGRAEGTYEMISDTLILRILKYSFKSYPVFSRIDPDTIQFAGTADIDLVSKNKVVQLTGASLTLEAVFGGKLDSIVYLKY